MKYKLINSVSKLETLCEKVTIDGFDYYMSDEDIKTNDWYYWSVTNTIQKAIKDSLGRLPNIGDGSKKIIATTNPNIDLPKMVNEVERLALKTTLHPKILFDELKKCSQNEALLIDEFGEYNIIRYRETTGFIIGYNKAKETYQFTEEDIIEFGRYRLQVLGTPYENYSTKELFQLWKEQQYKIIYYE